MKENRKIENVKVVIWDCDNTIWIHRKDEVEIVAKAMGIPVTDEFSEQYFGLFTEFGKYFKDKKVVYGKIIKLIHHSMPILSQYGLTAAGFLKKWIPIETSFLNVDALETIKYLNSQGYKNIVLTDWIWSTQLALLKKYEVLPYIDTVYTCDNQYLKKNPKSAARIIKEGCEQDYVMIGDSLKDDIAFANHAGIKSIWFNPEGKKNETKFKPTLEISSMLEVCRIIS